MPIVDIDRAHNLDKIHVKRMLHAFAELSLELIHLQDKKVDDILKAFSIVVMPGPKVGIEYPIGEKQILEYELNVEKALVEHKITNQKPKRKK